jgi:hypothetical protein
VQQENEGWVTLPSMASCSCRFTPRSMMLRPLCSRTPSDTTVCRKPSCDDSMQQVLPKTSLSSSSRQKSVGSSAVHSSILPAHENHITVNGAYVIHHAAVAVIKNKMKSIASARWLPDEANTLRCVSGCLCAHGRRAPPRSSRLQETLARPPARAADLSAWPDVSFPDHTASSIVVVAVTTSSSTGVVPSVTGPITVTTKDAPFKASRS